MSSARNVQDTTFMEADFSVGFDILDSFDSTTRLLGSLAKSQYPFTMYPITNATTATTTTPLAFSTSASIKPTTLASHPWSDMKDNSELSLPQSVAPNCLDSDFRPRHDSLLDISMGLDDFDPTNGFGQGFGDHQDTSDQDMDVDSNGFVGNDDDDSSTKSSPFSRGSSTISEVTGPSKSSSSRSPEPKEMNSKSDKMASPSKTKSKAKSKSKSKSKAKTRSTPSSTSASASTSTLGRPTKAARKQSGTEQLSPEAKRQRFLERNRLAAAKCREKKRLQTLKTIMDADEITAKNQALHESLDELQEEVRMLKNQILCHRDCGCDVIQKFVKTSLTVPSSSFSQRKMSLGNPSFSPPYFHDC